MDPTSPTPANPNPISPVSSAAPTTFAHQTSPGVTTATPHIDTSTPAINAAPVELDSIPTDAETVRRRGTGGSGGILSPADEEDIDGEFLGEGGESVGRDVKEKRAAMLATRSKDPSVIVNVPQDPTAEEVEAAKSAEGTITPAVEKVER